MHDHVIWAPHHRQSEAITPSLPSIRKFVLKAV
jgi:hypothetical protein